MDNLNFKWNNYNSMDQLWSTFDQKDYSGEPFVFNHRLSINLVYLIYAST